MSYRAPTTEIVFTKRIFRYEYSPVARTPLFLVIGSDYEFFATNVVTSVVDRYYDPTTDQFLSVDPLVAQTGQPYVFTNDNPLNGTDPLGLCFLFCWHTVAQDYDGARHWVSANAGLVGIGFGLVALTLATGGGDLIVAGGYLTAEQVAGLTLATGAVGTAIDGNSCINDGSYAGCAGMALGSVSGASAADDLLSGVSRATSYLIGDAGTSTAGKISTVSGGVALLLDIANYIKNGADSNNNAPTPKKK